MDGKTLRQQLVSAIAELPQETLVELLSFVDYQRYTSSRRAGTLPNQQSPVSPEMHVESIATTQPEALLYEQLSPQELAQAFLEWAESHRDLNLPILSDEAISRDSIYGELG